jgi:hypothetical protein
MTIAGGRARAYAEGQQVSYDLPGAFRELLSVILGNLCSISA